MLNSMLEAVYQQEMLHYMLLGDAEFMHPFVVDTNLFQFLMPDLCQMYLREHPIDINITLYDCPNVTFSNDTVGGPNVGIYLPLSLQFLAVNTTLNTSMIGKAENRTTDEAFLLQTLLVVNATVGIENNILKLSLKNNTEMIDFNLVRSKVNMPIDFYPLLNCAKQFGLNLINGPFKKMLEFQIPGLDNIVLENSQILI